MDKVSDESLAQEVMALLHHAPRRRQMRKAGLGLIDGEGAGLIAADLAKALKEKMGLCWQCDEKGPGLCLGARTKRKSRRNQCARFGKSVRPITACARHHADTMRRERLKALS